MKPDIIISVRFLHTSEGGRETPVQGQFYSCPLFVDGEGFDCRLLLGGRRLELGECYEVPVKFLYRDKALPKMKPGTPVHLWEGRNIADAQVVQIFES
ncbi:hypothetical protein [Comamonas sp. B21-038]|uniref:hypothetical protein n=1 Tax=Comamonas sp. B21-038 TaxID=2918299 RepID=UPI001EFB9549|nr:hypothetical protein [Comamonas sp. B21-038]ULR88299.1 hypothetical protein MJ205_17945 [Comamonas sp. B21-038]